MNPLMYAIGNFIANAPWVILVSVPFFGSERIKKRRILPILAATALLRSTAGFLLLSFVPNGHLWLDIYVLLHICVLLTVLCSCFKIHIAQAFYSVLLMVMLGTCVNCISYIAVEPFLPDKGSFLVAEPAWWLITALAIAIISPFVYRIFSRLLRQALFGLPMKSVLSLSFAPLVFYMMATAYVVLLGAFSSMFVAFIAVFAGLFLSYINLRLLWNTHKWAETKLELQMLEVKNEFMLENYQTLESHITQIARMKHEMRNHLFAVQKLCEDGEVERLLTYLSEVNEQFTEIEEPVICENRVIQAVLGHAARRAREMSFEIEFEILPLPGLSIPDTDLVSLFMNLLDNALESCMHMQNPKDRWLKVRLKTREPYLCLSVTNAWQGAVIRSEDTYISTKSDPLLHGHGIEIVRRIAEKHGGLASFGHAPDTFSAEVALPVV
jgi:uncharacterized membrane-anchored protein YhcB (DUF1043 family)